MACILSNTWQRVISSIMTLWLNQCDLDSHPLNVLADLLITHDKLKQASIELFADHPSSLIAIKEGFSQALFGYEQASAVKVNIGYNNANRYSDTISYINYGHNQFCERICLGIDMLLNTKCRESNSLKQVTESQNLVVLLRVVEVLQPLHNLEIAFAFEHFYRQAIIIKKLI